MRPIRPALALIAATLLNGSVALAMTQPACTGPAHSVCALPLLPASLIQPTDLIGFDERFAPPARPLDLRQRHDRAPVAPVDAADAGPSLASMAPPARPATLRSPAIAAD